MATSKVPGRKPGSGGDGLGLDDPGCRRGLAGTQGFIAQAGQDFSALVGCYCESCRGVTGGDLELCSFMPPWIVTASHCWAAGQTEEAKAEFEEAQERPGFSITAMPSFISFMASLVTMRPHGRPETAGSQVVGRAEHLQAETGVRLIPAERGALC